MSRLKRMIAAAGRSAAWLVPGERRDWIAALWAEAHEVPSPFSAPGSSRC